MGLTVEYGVKIDLRQSTTGNGLSNVVETVTIDPDEVLIDGTAAGQADLEYSISGTLSGPVTFDLDALVGSTGTLSMATVKLLYIECTDAANSIIFGGATFPFAPWLNDPTDTETIGAGGMLFRTAPGSGWTVGVGSAQNIKLNKVTSNATYRMVIVGTSV